jgi:glycosyltransferase involved in cell wall biosynthesis
MQLSFVIPAHNEEKRMSACLDSVMQELHRTEHAHDVEVVVVNNASTDRTKEIALRYPGVRVVDEPRLGLVRARARGFAETTGEFVANIDSDVMLPPGWLARVFREFERNPQLACLTGPLVYYDLSGWDQFLTQIFYWGGFAFHVIFRALKIGALVQGGNFVLRRDAWIRAGGFNTEIDFYGEDTDVAKRIVKQGWVKFSFYLPVLSSGRRLAREGVLATGWRYAINYFWVTVTGQPFTTTSAHKRAHLNQ